MACGKARVNLDDRSCTAVELLKGKLASEKQKTLRVTRKSRPVLLFTDGSLEYIDGYAVASIGGVLIAGENTLVYGATVPNKLACLARR